MTCEGCQENLSLFLDNELDEKTSLAVQTHLSFCADCAKVCEDFALILDSCKADLPAELPPPNAEALWCRINNIIESEVNSQPVPEEKPRGWFSRGFTLSQLASAAVAIALISSLLTIVGVRNYFEPTGEDFSSRSDATQTTFEKVFSKIGLIETPQASRLKRLKEQQAAIEYWNKRVQVRRAQWDGKMREAFDRNLNEIDEAVTGYTIMLEKNPQDGLSSEMLDSALDEKMNLLRAFAEL